MNLFATVVKHKSFFNALTNNEPDQLLIEKAKYIADASSQATIDKQPPVPLSCLKQLITIKATSDVLSKLFENAATDDEFEEGAETQKEILSRFKGVSDAFSATKTDLISEHKKSLKPSAGGGKLKKSDGKAAVVSGTTFLRYSFNPTQAMISILEDCRLFYCVYIYICVLHTPKHRIIYIVMYISATCLLYDMFYMYIHMYI